MLPQIYIMHLYVQDLTSCIKGSHRLAMPKKSKLRLCTRLYVQLLLRSYSAMMCHSCRLPWEASVLYAWSISSLRSVRCLAMAMTAWTRSSKAFAGALAVSAPGCTIINGISLLGASNLSGLYVTRIILVSKANFTTYGGQRFRLDI